MSGVRTYCATSIASSTQEVSGLIAQPLSQNCAIEGVRTYCVTPIAYLEVSGLIVLVDLIDNFCWWIWAIGCVWTYCATPIAYLEVDMIDYYR